MQNGGKVVYTGDATDGLIPGVHGHVLAGAKSYAHVQWLEGEQRGTVSMVHTDDLAPAAHYANTVAASLEDSLEVPSLISLASAQEAYDSMGGEGLVSHLSVGGHLASYASLVEDALQQIVAGLQQDPVLRQLTAQMDPEEADEVYRTAAVSLISESGDF